MSNQINSGLGVIAATPLTSSRPKGSGSGDFYEALATAWGQTLDKQANEISTMSDSISNGGDNPSEITKLTAESMKMSYLSQSSSTSLDSVGKALETMARKN